jgi:hypothetical protein
MAQRIARVSLATLLVLALVASPSTMMACGPDFSPPIFTDSEHPDLPLEKFAAGELGVVLPSYAQSYLVVAYRYFSGKRFEASEQKQLLILWNHYLNNEENGLVRKADAGESEWQTALEEIAPFQAANSRRPSTAAHFAMGYPRTYQSYQNCLDDAYHTAAGTLRERAGQFGPNSAAVQSWVSAQLTVFSDCVGAGAAGMPYLPAAADPNLPPVIRADRHYQIAAAYFYAGNWDEAEKRFVRIAGDSSSPWRAIAALVAARCEIRAATLGANDASAEARLNAADAQLRKIIADPSFSSVHAGAQRLRGYVEFRLQPDLRLLELSDAIERDSSPSTLAQDLDDYTKLVRQALQESAASPRKVPLLREKSAMTDWIFAFESGSDDAEAYRVKRWQETRSPAWLTAALTYAQPDTPEVAGLLEAAAQVPTNSAAYLTVAFQADRLLAATGKQAQARRDVDKILAMPRDRLPLSARNLFLALGLKLAENLDDFLRYAPRTAVEAGPGYWMVSQDAQAAVAQPMFDADASIYLTEKFPLGALAAAARSVALPKALRREVAIVAWTRAILLHEETIARELAPIVVGAAPELENAFAPYSSAKNSDARQFAAVFIILHTPGLRPFVSSGYNRMALGAGEQLDTLDQFRDNWWCAMRPSDPAAPRRPDSNYDLGYLSLNQPLLQLYPGGKIPEPSFLDQVQRHAAEKESSALVALPAAPTWLGEQTLAWANRHPADPRVPEALHLVVRSTRYGCADADSGEYSKQAFTLLHRRYPKSEWAERTPYWFH